MSTLKVGTIQDHANSNTAISKIFLLFSRITTYINIEKN